jgi:hypothetical protein
MTKEEVIKLMMKSMNDDNRDLCLRSGLSESETEKQMSESQPSLQYLMENLHKRMADAGLLN